MSYTDDKKFEVEAKFLIEKNKEQVLEKLKSLKQIANFVLQKTEVLNIFDYYFETQDSYLIKHETAYRLRKQNDKYLVTFKKKLGIAEGIYNIVREVETEITLDQVGSFYDFTLDVPAFDEIKKIIDIKLLTDKVEVENKRTIFVFKDEKENAIEISFDDIKTSVKDIVSNEAEIEIESKGASKESFVKFVDEFKKIFPDLEPTICGKVKRAVAKLGIHFENLKKLEL